MSLSVTLSQVQERCGLDSTEYTTPITNLINQTLGALEYAIQDPYLLDISNSGLQATLNLGALEILSGEFFAQLLRYPGTFDSVFVGGLEIQPATFSDRSDPTGLRLQGWERLRPYLKYDPLYPPNGVSYASGKSGGDE